MKYHNIRNSKGQFTRRVKRARDGKFASNLLNIVAGRLYNWKNTIVRAGHLENGKRFVSCHKRLFGFVTDCELTKIDKRKVNNYIGAV